MQRKYSYIIKKRKELLSDAEESSNSNLGSDLNEIKDIKFDDDLFDCSNSESLRKSESGVHKHYDANVICNCGHHFKNDDLSIVFFSSFEDIISLNKKNDIKCPKCNLKLDIVNSIKLEHSYSKYNVFRKKFFLFEEEEKVRIVLLTEHIQYNKKGKTFIQKDRKSITFNKKEKTFFYSGKYNNAKDKKIIGISNRNFNDIFSKFFKEASDDKICFDPRNTQNIFRHYDLDVIEPFNKFMSILIDNLDNKDVSRIMNYIDFLNYNDFDFYFRDYPTSISSKEKNIYTVRQNNKQLLRGYINNISIISSILQYSYNSNILFNKGKDLFIDILTQRDLPNTSYLKQKKPTSPTNIFIEAFNYKYVYSLYYIKKNLKSITKDYYPNLILNNTNIEKLKKWEKDKQEKNGYEINNNNFYSVQAEHSNILSYISIIENLKLDLIKNKNNLFLPKTAFNKLTSWDNMMFFISFSRYLNKEQIFYVCNKFDLNDFIFAFKRLNGIYSYENINESTFKNYESKIKMINFIFKIQRKEHIKLDAFPFDVIIDSLRCLKELYGDERRLYIKDIFKCHNTFQLKELHDNLYKKVLLKKNKDNDEKIRNFCEGYKEINTNIIENVSFKLIDNIDDLIEEGSFMKHCVGSYASRLAQGKHLIFSVKDLDTEERATLEFYKINSDNNPFNTNSVTWVFSQLKSKYNKKASENIINKFKVFYKKLEKSGLKLKIDNNSYDLLVEERKGLIDENEEFFVNIIDNDNLLPF
jgi:hypothetical protein